MQGRISDRRTVPGWTTRLVYVVFFLSGATGLVYEISWSRQIGLFFGHTVHAASVVLASFFGGMAFGYWIGAKWSRRGSPLRGYAIAEFVVAGWACCIPWLLAFTETTAVADWLSQPSQARQTAFRVLLCGLLLAPATISLGVTLPMMAAFFSNGDQFGLAKSKNSNRVTIAYALNTTGAFIGVLLSTFVLLINVGVIRTSYLAAGLSVLCAIAALSIHHVHQNRGQPDGEIPPLAQGEATRPHGEFKFAILLAALSGFGTLALQVLYTRVFSLVFHNSTYTFGTVVAVFVASLALGAAVTAWGLKFWDARRLAAFAAGLGALGIPLSILLFVRITGLQYFTFGSSFSQYILGAFGLVAIVVGPPITLLGMLLPLAWKLAGLQETAGVVVGRLTAMNTIAAAFGSLLASFWLLPKVGLWTSLVLVGGAFIAAALWILWRDERKPLALLLSASLCGLSILALQSPTEATNNQRDRGEKLVQRWNSSYGWIDVIRVGNSNVYKIRQDLHYRFGRTGNNVREFRQAHLPLLLHRQPHDVLLMGLGTGLTAGGAIPHREVESIVIAELIPEVVEAARLLADHNYGVVDHPKTEIYIDDARHLLHATDRKFDVMISDLFVPWESESGYLYTLEHYQTARQRLNPGGLFCQWLPLYQLGPREFESIANSFSNAFSQTTLWWAELSASRPVIALIGSDSPLRIESRELDTRLERLWQQIGSTDPAFKTSTRFVDHYLGDWVPAQGASLNSDEFPRVEFLTPISHRDGQILRHRQLERYFDDVLIQLPADNLRLDGKSIDSQATRQRRLQQRAVLFGG